MDKVSVPEGVLGSVEIRKFQVSALESCFFSCTSRGRGVSPGEYTMLKINGQLIMSDTPAEMCDHRTAVRLAQGHCLVGGLGLGMVVQAMLQKEKVTKVTVIEKNPDVIELVAGFYKEKFGERFEVILGDVTTWIPPVGAYYGVVWMDIWGDYSISDIPCMEDLTEKFEPISEWVDCWQMDFLMTKEYGEKCPSCECRGDYRNGCCMNCGYEEGDELD